MRLRRRRWSGRPWLLLGGWGLLFWIDGVEHWVGGKQSAHTVRYCCIL